MDMESEEIMWKQIYNKLQSQKSTDHAQTDHELRNMHLLTEKVYIDGEWVTASNKKVFEVYNPANGSVVGKVPDMDVHDAEKAVVAAANAFETWKFTTAKERAHLLRKWYNLLVENQESIAKIMTAESGKPLPEAVGEVMYGNSFVEWFSEQARNVRGEIIPSPVPSKKILVDHHPIGAVGLITPWNFPHAMITRKASAALAVGCTCVIKPAEDTPLTALALMKLAEEAGFPKGVLNIVTSGRKNAPGIGALFCKSPLVAGISFTGSTQVGKILYKQCSSGIKRLGLELGGNAPFIVYNSANVNKAVEGALTSKFRNCGQTCVAANRFLIQDDIYDSFVNALVKQVCELKIGDGMQPGLKTEEESLAIANATERGLAGYFYSEDLAQIFRVSNKLEVGMIGVNEGLISSAEAPFELRKIQQVDGGFFEKFGSLFREHAELAATEEELEKVRVAEAAAQVVPDKNGEESDNEVPPTMESDAESSSDSEIEGEKDNAEILAAAFNIDELYAEILYEILHNVGCDVNYEVGPTVLFSYAQDAFKIANDKHRYLLEVAEKKEAPELLLNVEVIEAKDLAPKDSNGLSDPFVTLFLASNTSHKYNTSVKSMTLSPVWEEHFALPITDNVCNDTLCLEVWDFDPAESVKEKIGKFFEVKGIKGMRKLVKEIAVTATSGQHENELIGRARIPLSTIPASGMTMWYSLDKKNKINRQGVLKVRVSYSSEKNSQVAEQEHRHMLRIILMHELETSKVAHYWWSGTFSPQGEQLLTQHVAQSGLNPTEVAICEWSVYASIHQTHPLSFTLKRNTSEKMKMKQVTDVLKIFNHISSLDPPPNTDLFPQSLYQWVTYQDEPNCNIAATLNDAVTQGANDWFNHILENNKRSDETDIFKLQNLMQIILLVKSDLQKAIEFYDKLFQETINFEYAKALYVFYQAKISSIAEPEVTKICKGLKKLDYTGYSSIPNGTTNTDHLTEGTSLFELYLAMQRFAVLGIGLCPADCDTFHIKNFHQWFHGGVAQWLDIAVYKALQRIEKAVDLDKLVHVDSTVKYSSSAVDTLTIFYQVKTFWQQLNWPDVEGCYTFIAKIIDDICRCCVFYADKMSAKVDGMGDVQNNYEKKFEVTNEWCLAINNIDYVRETLEPFTRDLGMDEVIQKISDLKSPVEAQRCQHTMENVIANAIDTVRNKICELLETVVAKMAPAMKRLLIEGAELCNQDSNSIDRLMMYVDNNLSTLHRELNEENFNRTLEIVWDMLSKTLGEIIQSNLEKRRPPSFFDNLRKTLNLMLGSFKNPADCDNCDDLKRTEQILRIHGLETADLIHQAHLDLSEEFKKVKESPYGEISIRCKFEGNTLTLEIMNARNLIAMDSNGSCDAFVRVHFLPEHKFSEHDKPKTKTHNKTQFPLFDEKFVIHLTQEQRNLQDALILFSVKDKDLLGYNNQYIGEAFYAFRDIEDTTLPITSLPQIHLHLGRPSGTTLDAFKALEYRQGDKQAKEFFKKLRQRMGL
ncbi:hypothetical protein NQ317_006759 [Molorchus minor]|uniref:Uncharacterized protein n=1 Tax=Molorchus minor TaxID=1323400 RepID=A0ABQ9JQE8_9CUCU|nr:hypothetical protein NQ317_006759 [Molorchus minor]